MAKCRPLETSATSHTWLVWPVIIMLIRRYSSIWVSDTVTPPDRFFARSPPEPFFARQ